MFESLRDSDPSEPLWRTAVYRACRKLCAIYVRTFYRLRVMGEANIPGPRDAAGAPAGLLLISNHQSHLDPLILGTGMGRRNLASLARVGLFGNRLFALLLHALGSIPIKQNDSDTAAIRTTIAELKKGRAVMVFPEGSRSPDGTIQPFKRGTWLLMSRAGCDILPAAVDGAFQAWPRTRTFPRLFGVRCAVNFGQPIPYERLKDLRPDEGLELLRGVVEGLQREIYESPHVRSPRHTTVKQA